MFEEKSMKLSKDVPIQNSSPNYEDEYETYETFAILKH